MNAFAAHVEQLATEGGVLVAAVLPHEERWKSMAVPPAKFIQVAPVTDEETYAIALHELGHCLAEDGHHPKTIVAERAAWAWAEERMFWKSPAMEALKARVMGRADVPDEHHVTYERQAALEPLRKELEAIAAVMPPPNGETIKSFMDRRKRR